MFLFCAVATYASSKGAGGFTKATTEISYRSDPRSQPDNEGPSQPFIVLVGAFNVYFKRCRNGETRMLKKTIMMTIGGCVAFIAMSEALPMFFK
jgi:hypothetical protein